MESTQNFLQVLSESLDKKLVILKELESLTLEQKELFEAKKFDGDAFNLNVEKKSGLIVALQRMDKGFQVLYNRIKNQIQGNEALYSGEIKELQQKITQVMDFNASLQVKESRNKEMIEKKFSSMKKEVRVLKKNKKTVANYYKTMNNITTEPIFLDKKK